MQINIHCIGKMRSSDLQMLMAEYLKRIKWPITTKEVICNKPLPKEQLCRVEGEMLLSGCPDGFIIVLDEKGQHMDSKEFAALLDKVDKSNHKKLYFLIGGAHGHDAATLKKANKVISLSKLTFPHQMVRLILVEQIYRAFTINNNHPYHKD
jgi:23S rRNA (pseudouridine1915-N3)-methyltransferase